MSGTTSSASEATTSGYRPPESSSTVGFTTSFSTALVSTTANITTSASTTPISTTAVSTSLTDTAETASTQAAVSEASTTQSDTTPASVSQSSTSSFQATQSAQPAKSISSGLSGGVVAGVGIGALIIGALIASAFFIMLQKKRQRRRRTQRSNALGAMSTENRPSEKLARTAVDVVPQSNEFDLDRLLPQPFDDSRVKGEVKVLFTQIDSHVENFYTENNVNSKTQVSTDASESEMLLYPRTRFFALKRLICLAMVEAISFDGPSEHSLLPLGFGTTTRQLKEIDLNDQANTLSWARLRSSMGYLLRSDLGTAEQKRVDRVVGAIVVRLNAQTQAFELAGTPNERAADLDAICRSSAALGRLLLSQPAEWNFDWQSASNARSRSQFVYFPSLVRLTDNKGKKLRTPHVAITAKETSV